MPKDDEKKKARKRVEIDGNTGEQVFDSEISSKVIPFDSLSSFNSSKNNFLSFILSSFIIIINYRFYF